MNEIDEYLADMDRKVRKFGWARVYVFGDDCAAAPGEPCTAASGDCHTLGFGYTVGLSRHYGHPELVMTGVPVEATEVLNILGERIRDGAVLRPGERLSIGHTLTARLLEVDWEQSHRNMPVAWRLNGGPVDALQVVLPDSRNRMPWEPGYSLSPEAQPLWGSVGGDAADDHGP